MVFLVGSTRGHHNNVVLGRLGQEAAMARHGCYGQLLIHGTLAIRAIASGKHFSRQRGWEGSSLFWTKASNAAFSFMKRVPVESEISLEPSFGSSGHDFWQLEGPPEHNRRRKSTEASPTTALYTVRPLLMWEA